MKTIKLPSPSHPSSNNNANSKSKSNTNSHTTMIMSKKNETQTQKSCKKSIRPFRIKPNTIVAVRYHAPPSSKSNSYTESWLDPIPNRDTNYNLIGKYIRCIFPKKYHQDLSVKGAQRVLEGEIVGLLESKNDVKNEIQKDNVAGGSSSSNNADGDDQKGIPVKLLIDQKAAFVTFPFLKQHIHDDIITNDSSNISNSNNNNNNNTTNKDQKKAAKNKKLEEQIRGKDKVIIHLTLAPIQSYKTKSSSSSSSSSSSILLPKWVIRKWVPLNKIKKQLEQMDTYNYYNHYNNNNEENDQEWIENEYEHNIRWLASMTHYHHNLNSNNNNNDNDDDDIVHNDCYLNHDYYHVGQVIDVKINKEEQQQIVIGKKKASLSSSLAIVTVKRMILPEITKQGRLLHHDKQEIFELYHNEKNKSNNKSNNNNNKCSETFQVPIEKLIVIGQKLHHLDANNEKNHDQHKQQQIGKLDFVAKYQYDFKNNSFLPIISSTQSSSSSLMTSCNPNIVSDDDVQIMNNTRSLHNELLLHSNSKQSMDVDLLRHKLLGLEPTYTVSTSSSSLSSTKSTKAKSTTTTSQNNESDLICTVCQTAISENELEICPITNKKYKRDCMEWERKLSQKKRRLCLDDKEGGVAGEKEEEIDIILQPSKKASFLSLTEAIFASAQPMDFDLPLDFLGAQESTTTTTILSSSSNVKNDEKSPIKRPRKKAKKKKTSSSRKSPLPQSKIEEEGNNTQCLVITHAKEEDDEDFQQFKSTSARCLPYDSALKKKLGLTNNSAAHAKLSVASMRSGGRKVNRLVGKDDSNSKINSSRAARANQRRRNKEITMLGLNQATNMTGREDALRFGKSTIHGWGVFSDSFITGGDLIVEYRGVLIGNTVADKREKEYERAKIGSDYMFRIDGETVCDATRHGNVARFINASCTPNCYTQIITINGAKRIAIYAKRDIAPGEELSYDYKFQPEFDESKRIPCNCGTPDCRGFMNWNKKYVPVKDATYLKFKQNRTEEGRGL